MSIRRISAALLLALALAGCGPAVKTRTVAVRTGMDANGNAPVALALVMVYDRDLAAELEKLPARGWFEGRAQFTRDYPRGFREVVWELVPGQSVAAGRVPLPRKGARALFVFADYTELGEHRLRVDPFGHVMIVLGPEEIAVQAPAR